MTDSQGVIIQVASVNPARAMSDLNPSNWKLLQSQKEGVEIGADQLRCRN